MSSHAQIYGVVAPFKTIALFGATGQIGEGMLNSRLSSQGHTFRIIAFIPKIWSAGSNNGNVDVKTFDVENATREGLAKNL
jgi:aspartate-semialdehyde dehydrogenase